MTENQPLRISVNPEPNDREKATIVATVLASLPNVQEDETSAPANKWREAGKRESLREHIWERYS